MIVREGLRALLGVRDDIEVIAEAVDGSAAVAAVSVHRPDVVVMDISMPKLNGIDATTAIRNEHPTTKVLILSMHDGEEYVRPALRAGASGYLLKGAGLSDLVAAVQAVARGEAFFSPPIARIVLQDSRRDPRSGGREPQPGDALTNREREILKMVAESKSSPEIARLLSLSVKTVEGHRARIVAKLDVHGVAGLVRHAIKLGLVSPDA
jgi:DNA-binding NarL/FixJ family response regulator